ncbi:MAG: hypothetical protein ACC655_07805 [Rhodothermia bacterium]
MTALLDGTYEWSLLIDGDEALFGISYGDVRDNDSLGVIVGAVGSYRATDLRVDNVLVELLRKCDFGLPEQPVNFVRQTGRPSEETVVWESCGGTGRMLVTSEHVSSAYIQVNGAMLLSPHDFNGIDGVVEVPVSLLEGSNILEVELRGKPGSNLAVMFEPVE